MGVYLHDFNTPETTYPNSLIHTYNKKRFDSLDDAVEKLTNKVLLPGEIAIAYYVDPYSAYGESAIFAIGSLTHGRGNILFKNSNQIDELEDVLKASIAEQENNNSIVKEDTELSLLSMQNQIIELINLILNKITIEKEEKPIEDSSILDPSNNIYELFSLEFLLMQNEIDNLKNEISTLKNTIDELKEFHNNPEENPSESDENPEDIPNEEPSEEIPEDKELEDLNQENNQENEVPQEKPINIEVHYTDGYILRDHSSTNVTIDTINLYKLKSNREEIESISFNSVSNVSAYSFINLGTLKEVSFSDKITEIGAYSFYGCTNLSSVKYKNMEFNSLKELKNVLKENNVTLGTGAFENTNL